MINFDVWYYLIFIACLILEGIFKKKKKKGKECERSDRKGDIWMGIEQDSGRPGAVFELAKIFHLLEVDVGINVMDVWEVSNSIFNTQFKTSFFTFFTFFSHFSSPYIQLSSPYISSQIFKYSLKSKNSYFSSFYSSKVPNCL